MTPAARVQAQIEVLDLILTKQAPADRVLDDYARARRYIGAKDRRVIVSAAYGVLRHRARLDWWCARVSEGPPTARRLVIAALALIEGRSLADIEDTFNGARYRPAPLEPAERALAAGLIGRRLEDSAQDIATRLEIPVWLLPSLTAAFGSDLEPEMTALNREAPVDLRVNALKTDRESARIALAKEGIEAVPHPFAPFALRLAGRVVIHRTQPFREGLVEVQDAASQIAAQMCGAEPGLAVADYCAGAGGKTLALAAAMENRGRLVALDVDQARLDRAAARLRRAGASMVERRVLRDGTWLKSQACGFDRVLVDAPCSGSGAWRRDPHARWRLCAERLAYYRKAQAESLSKAAGLVRPGGRLVYVTCSLLPEENEMQIKAFLSAHGSFAVVPAVRAWAETLGRLGVVPPVSTVFKGEHLCLTPARHDTDGFFVSVLERSAAK